MTMSERRRLLTEYIRDDADEELDYFTIIPYSDNISNVSLIAIEYPHYVIMREDASSFYSDIWYSLDGGEWVLYSGEYIEVPCFSKVRFKGNWHEVMKDVEFIEENISIFNVPRFYSASGQGWWLLEGTPLSLIHGDNFKERKNDWNYGWDSFHKMFLGNQDISQINNPKTFLPSTELSYYCYASMFADSFIQNAPELPAETLKIGCYNGMFRNCYYLEEAPALNAKTIVPYCYEGMFFGCFYLCYAKVTATDGFDAEHGAWYMFYGCADYGLAVLSNELINEGFVEGFIPKWAIIGEDYPTNNEGYPETKGSIHDYENALCFNVPFSERFYKEYDDMYYNYFLLEANKLGKELYDDITSWAIKGEFYGMLGIFVNRQPIFQISWREQSLEDGTVDECIQFNFENYYGIYYGILDPDGTFYIYKNGYLIHDYIK